MQVKYRSFGFTANSVGLTTDIQTLFNSGGQPYAQLKRFRCEGKLTVSSQADATSQWNALAAALAVPFGDLTLLNDDSSTALILPNAGSITGVRVTSGPNMTSYQGAVWGTWVPFAFAAEAEYPLAGTANLLKSWRETLAFSGGGPLYAHMPAINGFPQKQLIYPAMPYACVQSGQIVGLYQYPAVPPPLFPFALKENPNIKPSSPTRKGFGYEDFAWDYSYSFEDAAPLVGLPNFWVF